MPSHDTNVQYMTKVTYANLQDLVRIFTYSSAANRQDDFQDLHGSKIYVQKSKWKENLERKAPSGKLIVLSAIIPIYNSM